MPATSAPVRVPVPAWALPTEAGERPGRLVPSRFKRCLAMQGGGLGPEFRVVWGFGVRI